MPPEKLLIYEFKGGYPPCGKPCDSAFLGIWPEPPFYYLFFSGEPGQGLSQWLGRQQGWVLRDTYHLAYEEWQQVAVERLHVGPFRIDMAPGVASRNQAEEGKGIVIQIDPGLVFGSGIHGSTRGCLLAVTNLFDEFPAESVVDMGAGTGILAVSCGALGAARVLAIDKNPLAIRAAARNVFLNRMQNRVELVVAEDLRVVKVPSDLLMMNLEPPILERLLAGDDWRAYPWVILSGFLEKQWDRVKINIPPAFRIWRWETVDGWQTVTLSRGRPASGGLSTGPHQ